MSRAYRAGFGGWFPEQWRAAGRAAWRDYRRGRRDAMAFVLSALAFALDY